MGEMIDKLLQKWDEFQSTHTRVDTPELRSLVFSLYHYLQGDLKEEAVFTLKDEGSMATITIAAQSFLSCSHFPALQQLIAEADTFQAEIHDDRILIEMLFVFCKWIPKS